LTGFLDFLSTSMTLNYLEPPSPPKKRFLVISAQFLDAAHISTVNCDEISGDKPKQHANETFSIQRKFQRSKSRPPRFKEAGAGERESYFPLKSDYFTEII